MHKHKLGLALFVGTMALVSGCDLREPDSVSSDVKAQDAPSPASAVAAAPAVALLKADAVNQASLKSGLDVIVPRITAKVEPYQPVKALPTNRLLLHPSDDKSAVVEISTEGLGRLTLSPFIEYLGGSEGCANNPDAGVVEFAWSLDGAPGKTLMVDRNYASVIDVDVSGSKALRLEVSKGNGVTWCDWASVGFTNVVAAAPQGAK